MLWPIAASVPLGVSVSDTGRRQDPAKTVAPRSNSLDESALRNKFNGHFFGNHLLLGLGVQANVAHNRFADQLCADELADARPGFGGVIGNDREISLFLVNNFIHETLRRANAHEPADHQASAVGDHADRLADGYRLHFISPIGQMIFCQRYCPIAALEGGNFRTSESLTRMLLPSTRFFGGENF